MKLVTCEHPWHNLAACYATVTNTTLEDVIKHCGHDGSTIVWNDLQNPYDRLHHHTQEMIDYCLSINYSVTTITKTFATLRDNQNIFFSFSQEWLEKRFMNYMRNYYGVLIFDFGATVWNGEKIMIPQLNREVDFIDQNPEVFFIVTKML